MMERCTHQVPTLFSLASDVVKDNVLLYCHKDPNVTSIRDLPACLASFARKCLIDIGKLDSQLAKVIFTESIQYLNLTQSHRNTFKNGAEIVKVASLQCPLLTVLLFSGSGHQSDSYLGDFLTFSRFQHLRVLDISVSSANDSCMYILAKHCSKLQALSVSKTIVSHVGLEHLLIGLNCLQVLFLRYTKISQDKLCMLLHKCSPSKLKVLDSEFEIPAFANGTLKRPSTILVSAHFERNGIIHFMSQNWFIETLQISNHQLRSNVKDADLLQMNDPMILLGQPFNPDDGFGRLEGDINITFEGVKSVLGKFGRTILNLKMSGVSFVDLAYIRSNCSYLMYFIVERVELVSNLDDNESLSFPHLKFFRCIDNPHHLSWGERQLAEILSSPNLSLIMLSHCDCLTDRCLTLAYKKHQFKKLENLALRQCNNIHIETFILVFLKTKKSLKKLTLVQCNPFRTASSQLRLIQRVKQIDEKILIEFPSLSYLPMFQ